MKKLIALLLALVLVVGMLAGCSTPAKEEASTPAESGDPIKIGVAFATENARRFKFDEMYMRKVAEANGAELLVQWANYEQTKQENQVENLISQGIDVLILVAVSTNMSPLVEKVKAEGIPVVCYDNFIADADLDAYLDRDNYAAGVMQMEMTMETIGGKGNIAIIHGEPTSAVVQGMKIGYDDVLKKYPDVKVVVEQYHEGYSAEKALKTAENTLSAQNNDIQAFVCTADVLALGLLPAVEAAGISGNCYITGMDCEVAACQSIYEGKMGVSIWTEIDKCATRCAEIAIALAKGESFDFDEEVKNGDFMVPKVFVPIMGVTKDNMQSWVDTLAPEGWITMEEVTG